DHIGKSADEAVDHEIDAVDYLEGLRIDVALKRGEERAADPAIETGDDEGDHSVFGDIDAEAGGEILVLAQRVEHGADPARIDQPEEDEAENEQDAAQIEIGEAVAELESRNEGQAEQR